MPDSSISTDVVEQIVALLQAALDQPNRRQELGQQAAILWWELDLAGFCNTEPPETWERALLSLAAWYTGDDSQRLQRADDDDIQQHLERLGRH